jgi:carbamoyl-phosphate synthase large subunit
VIGHELVPKLVAAGATVLVGDLKPRPASFSGSVLYRQGDLNRISTDELAAFAPDTLIHLAATFERSTESYGFGEENFLHNVRLSHHVMTIAKDLPSLKRVVFASSYLIYEPSLYEFDAPRTTAVALKESDPVLPRNLTGMAKFAHEIELRFLDSFRSQAFTTMCARIYRGYGRRSRDVISRWIRSLLAGETIKVFRPEGRFDYIYAVDSAEGLLRLADATEVTGIINLGTGRSRSVADVISILRTHFPDMSVIEEASDIPFEASQADMTRYQAAIGWTPQYDLEKAIAEIVEFESHRTNTAPVIHGNLLISSAAAKVPLVRAAMEAAAKLHPDIRIIAGDLNPEALTKHIAHGFWAMPPTHDEQLSAIIDGCAQQGIRAILPTRDGELAFWARHAATFAKAGIQVIVSPSDAIDRCLDKALFTDCGLREQLPVIATSTSISDIDANLFVVKERFGAGSRAIGIRLDRDAAIAHADTLDQPIFQPFIDGQEISIDAWADRNGIVKGLVLRRRDEVVNGESRITTTFRDAALESRAKQWIEAYGVRGPVVIQVLLDAAGVPHIIELNARFGGASTTSIQVGLDSLYWSLLEATGGDVSQHTFVRSAMEVRQVRIPTDIHIHGTNL